MGKRKTRVNMKSVLNSPGRGENYPHCNGTFDTCADSKITDPYNPPSQCRNCPMYVESRYHSPARKIEMDDFVRSIFSK